MTDMKNNTAETIKDADRFEQYLIEHPFKGIPENLYDAMNYMMQLGGKRMRPKLLLMAYESCALKVTDDALKLALAIETFHNFSLIHDDILDNAPLRRGKKTVHKEWNESTAILAGDNMLAKCYDLILNSEIGNKESILKIFTKVAVQICEGQQMDMNLPFQKEVTEYDYLEMIKLKTAVLPATSMQIGALAANADNAVVESFYQFGLNLGMAFQLQDDYLDAFGSAEEIGKQAGGDIMENKKTIIYLHAMKHLDMESRTILNAWYTEKVHDSAMKVEEVRHLFRKSKSDVYLLELKNNYEQMALQHLEIACKDEVYKQELTHLFDQLKNRKG
jgi:geranylgeranyl diphosphate synthase type II